MFLLCIYKAISGSLMMYTYICLSWITCMRETFSLVLTFCAPFQCTSLSDIYLQSWSCYSVLKEAEITLTFMGESFWLATLSAHTNDAHISKSNWASWRLRQSKCHSVCYFQSIFGETVWQHQLFSVCNSTFST